MPKGNYLKSNSILSIDFKPKEKSRLFALKILTTQDHIQRQVIGENLLKSLSDDAKVSHVKLKISATRQWSRMRSGRIVAKLYGYYRPKTNPPANDSSRRRQRAGYIYIQNLTSVRASPVAAKTFLNTLLHEWLHHYDTEKLKLHSIHTKGFYLRLSSLKESISFYSLYPVVDNKISA